MVYTVQIEIYLRKENCNFISTQDITREHGSAIRKLSFSFTHPIVGGNKLGYFCLSEANQKIIGKSSFFTLQITDALNR